MTRGLVLIIAGIWVGCQVFGGNALQRLNIVKPTGDQAYAHKLQPPGAGGGGGGGGGGSF
jgi:hypothetical protein